MNDLITLVTKMREYQRQYFESARKGMPSVAKQVLPHAKAYEAKVDKLLAEIKGSSVTQNELF